MSRINSGAVQGAYFSTENSAPVAPAAAAPAPLSAPSSASAHPIRTGGQNLARFNAVMNRAGSELPSRDVTTEEGRANYKLDVRAWAEASIEDAPARKALAERIDLWLEANDPGAMLDLSGSRIMVLPPLPSNLQSLSVKDCQLMWFNQELPSGLKVLDASDNPLAGLPNLPDTLERLDIHGTRVSWLPSAPPANLGFLNISDTEVTEVPDHLLQAAARPDSPLMLVAEGITLPGQTTPQANQPTVGTTNRYGVGMASLSLSQAVEAWYGAPDAGRSEVWNRIYQDSQDGLANATVPLWKVLDSLKITADYPSEAGDTPATREARSETRTAFKQRVTHLLDAMASDADLRKTCLDIAHDRVETCQDNIALGFEEMEQAHEAARAAKGEFPQDVLFNMGMGRLKLALLDELAIPKGNAVALEVAAETGRPVDDVLETVEVVLAYRLGLAERLDLPTRTKQMLYSATASVTAQDLSEAEAKVREALADDKQVASFMVGWRPWQVELERRHPEEFSAQAVGDAKDRLRSELEGEQASYETFCQEEGEFSENALNSLAKINRIGSKFNTVEQDTFAAARERLTKAYMDRE